MINRVFYGWWIVLACFFISLYIDSVVFFGFTAFFDPLIEEFGWSYAQVSFAASLRGLGMGVFAPVVGFLVDRFGPKRLIFSGTVLVGSGLILLSLTRSLAMFYVSFLFLASGAVGCTSVVTMSAVVNWFDRNVGKALGVMASGFGASGLVVPLIVWLIDAFEWRTAWIILGLGMWGLGIPLSFVIRDRPEHEGSLSDRSLVENSAPQYQMERRQVDMSLKWALKDRSFLYLNVAEAIRMMTVSAVVTHVMPYLGSMGIPRSTAGLVAGAIPVISIIGRLGFGWLGDVYEKRYVMAAAFCLMGLGMPAFCYVQARWAIFIFLLLFSTSFAGGRVLSGAILKDYFGTKSFGKMLGIVMASTSIGGTIGPLFAGWVFDHLNSYRSVWLILSGLIGLAAIQVLRMRSATRSEAH